MWRSAGFVLTFAFVINSLGADPVLELPPEFGKNVPVINPKVNNPGNSGKLEVSSETGKNAPKSAQSEKSIHPTTLSRPVRPEITLPNGHSPINVNTSGSVGEIIVPMVPDPRNIDVTPEDRTMLLNHTRKALAFVLGAAICASPAVTAADPTPAEIKKAIDDLKQVTSDLKAIKEAAEKVGGLQSRIVSLEAKMSIIEDEIKEISKKLNSTNTDKSRTTLRPDTLNQTESYKGKGRLRFINEFSEEMSVIVNGSSFRLVPGEERTIPVTPGELTYQVLQLQRSAQARKIAADEVKTIRIYPLP